MYVKSSASLSFIYSFFALVNSSQALQVNPGGVNCNAYINLSLADKSMMICLLHLFFLYL